MTDRYVNPARADDTGDGLTWATAKKYLLSGTAAAAAGETVYFATGTADVITVDTTYTLAAGVRVISTSDTTNNPPTTYATGATVSTTTTGVDVIVAGTGALYGLTFSLGDSTDNTSVLLGSTTGSQITAVDCSFILGGNSTNAAVHVGYPADQLLEVVFIGCSFTWGATAQGITHNNAASKFIDCDMSAGATHPSVLFEVMFRGTAGIEMIGCDLSDIATVFEATPSGAATHTLRQCKLKAAGTIFAPSGSASGEVLVFDCDDGDSHVEMAHYTYRGSTLVEPTIYVADHIADSALSWKVAGNANTTKATPSYSPWISVYHSGTSAITPYLECVRSGSATAYNEDEVWVEALIKTATNTTQAKFTTNRSDPLTTGVANENSAKTGSDWTGENATSWFGKLMLPSVTPTDPGYISMRVGVSGNHTVYIDPQIRGLS